MRSVNLLSLIVLHTVSGLEQLNNNLGKHTKAKCFHTTFTRRVCYTKTTGATEVKM